MTNWEKWLEDNTSKTSTENKINFICEQYNDCDFCPLVDNKCGSVTDVEKWLNAESEE